MTLNIAIFGAGQIGSIHATSVKNEPRTSLVAVHDVLADAATALAQEHGIETRDAKAILADPDIDAILIASSTNTHVELIQQGVAAGKAIFCEKPIDLSLARALAVQEIVAAADRPVMMGFNRRFDPNFTTLKAAFDGGEVGKGEMLTITSYDPAPPPVAYIKVSGGLFRDMMIHDFDLCSWMFGLPTKVTATGACLVDPAIGEAGDIDTAVVTLTYADGRIATIRNSRRALYGYDQRIELLGEKGMLSAQNELENTVVKSTKSGVVSAKPVYFFLERYRRAYQLEWAAFVDAVVEGKDIPTTVVDGVNALSLAEAANLSLKNGCTVELASLMVGT
jgi:myo-inositol 2-dehydrogenase/D-chiro-inositol 1-dehydrogenase